MQEEVNSKTVAISVQASKVSMQTMFKVAQAAIRDIENKKKEQKSKSLNKGKQTTKKKMTVNEFTKKYDGLKTVEIDDSNIKSFEKYARKYNLEYALKKDKITDPPTFVLFFKGKDTDMISQAFKEMINDNMVTKKPSLLETLKKFSEKALGINKDKTRHKHKEQSL